MPLHIAIISYHTCPLASKEGSETGGMNTYVSELANALAKLGHKVDVFTRMHGDNLNKVERISDNLRIVHLVAGEKKNCSPRSLLEHTKEFSSNFMQFKKDNSLNYDVFHSHYYLSGLVALNINTLQHEKTPVIMTFHTLAIMKNLVVRNSNESESSKRIDAELNLVFSADKIIVSCETEKSQLQFLYNSDLHKIEIISPGVNEEIFVMNKPSSPLSSLPNKPKVFNLLFVGRVQSLKGIDHLLYAFKIISQKYPHQFSLTIMGGVAEELKNNEEFTSLKNMVEFLNIASLVHFLPQCTQKDLATIYQKADLLILPSYYETFGLVALESMACGIPAIVTSNCGISEIIQKHLPSGLTFPAGNPITLAKTIEQLFNNPILYKNLCEEVYSLARHYTWHKIAKKTLVIYTNVLL